MAVQAQYPANIFRSITMKNNVLDLHQQHDFYQFHQNNNQISTPLPGSVIGNTYTNFGKQQSNLINGGVLSGDHLAAESELTCNLSASRKRNRLDCDDHYQNMPPTLHQSYLHLQQQNDHVLLQKQQQNFRYSNKLQQINIGGSSNTGISINYEETNNHRLHQHHESAGTSTSGRSSVLTSSPAPMGSQQDLLMNTNHHRLLHHQNLEIDALILLHNEKLRSVIEETQKRQCRSLVSAVEEQVLKRLAEKETELQNAGRKNAELEEKLKQLNAENQVWFNVAKNNEAIASSLKSTLQQILLQNNNTKSGVEAGGELLLTANTTSNHDQKEGFGDSDGLVIEGLDDDAQSSCYGGKHNQEDKKRKLVDAKDNKGTSTIKKSCKVCEKNEVSVLVLPCRHLCLCKECEAKLDYCPICKAAKKASLQIFMS
ncbi:hypothetical protein C5167_022185 [Papaver somniferum]|uniref:RING-type domain-containing protein n=1 Tax=Papaver somniferum TaxID=3469 RepID=A0A4Y7JKX0_PAPSO|nr:probable BOI-related E3 ubiquitin-protein ligase 3 [Papaver somniferum]RZC60428.1 hypothetical protein C5167_022185 [Papaver somniferum]